MTDSNLQLREVGERGHDVIGQAAVRPQVDGDGNYRGLEPKTLTIQVLTLLPKR